jgi:predicted RecB family nuclease
LQKNPHDNFQINQAVDSAAGTIHHPTEAYGLKKLAKVYVGTQFQTSEATPGHFLMNH